MRSRCLCLLFVVLYACPAPTSDTPDLGPPPQDSGFEDAARTEDASSVDAGAVDMGFEDAEAPDTGIDVGTPLEDAGPAMDAEVADAGFVDAATRDAEVVDTGPSGPMVCPPVNTNYVGAGNMNGSTVFLPGGPNAQTVNVIETDSDRRTVYVAQATQANNPAWVAQVASTSPTVDVRVSDIRHDTTENATYVAFSKFGVSESLRFYHANGTQFREYTVGGTIGNRLSGARQANFFVAKYDSTGTIVWLKRFGPDDDGGMISGSLGTLSLTTGEVHVSGGVGRTLLGPNDPGTLVFGPGETDQLSEAHPESSFVASFDRATGNYVAGSARFFEYGLEEYRTTHLGSGAINDNGELILSGYMSGGRGGTIDLDRGIQVTTPMPFNAALIAKFDGQENLAWSSFIHRVGVNAPPRPSATLLSDDGSVVVAGTAAGASTRDIPFEIGTRTGTVGVTMDGRDVWIVRYTPMGDVSWFYRIGSTREEMPYRFVIDDNNDALYLLGTGSASLTFDVGLPTQTRISASGGRYIAKFVLSSGTFVWARALSAAFVEQPILRGNRLVAPLRYLESEVAPGVTIRKASGVLGWGMVEYDLDGNFVSCGDLVDTGSVVRLY